MNKVMIVDDSITSLTVAKAVLEDSFQVIPVLSGLKALELLNSVHSDTTLLLLDVDMPDITGYDVLRRIKENKKLRDIPVIFLTGNDDESSEVEGFKLGAVDYINKPFSGDILKSRVHTHTQIEDYKRNLQTMVNEQTKKIMELQYTILSTIANLIGDRDGYTGEHTNRVSEYTRCLATALALSDNEETLPFEDVDKIAISSKLHDLGKIAVPDGILLKVTRLTDKEWEWIKSHTVIGANAIEKSMKTTSDNEFLNYAYQMARSHHERYDGTGYPDRLAGKAIPLAARLMAIADSYDAITSDRCYDTAKTHDYAVGEITRNSGSQFDPHLVNIFLRVQEEMHELKDSMNQQ